MTRQNLETVLNGLGPVAVAVSGGVDSLTLATLAHRLAPGVALMVHAVSPAVPGEATARVRAEAAREGWSLRVIEAGEFADPAYRANPVNRCFFCKTNLYGAVRRVTDRQILSGANRDDLGEYRPGLDAARAHGVRHPYVEAGFDKAAVRRLARDLGLGAVAELPSAPCLSSRVETGIAIEPETLTFIHAVERLVSGALDAGSGARAPSAEADTGSAPGRASKQRLRAVPDGSAIGHGPERAVRCRVRAEGVVVELDPGSLAALDAADRETLGAGIRALAPPRLAGLVRFAPYRVGSAFLVDQGEARA
ncbi:adenine nucleotide alpha hydrolase [Methylobacterium sp. E-005]|uniref:adenine nucleotide alpha hydrolase n=1 Tax=Methylobacterium sp. E-005 TaxID=2836549 RepID=UPI001FBAB3EB|nr:adenine nucleotide alpha hydrolase [Methylobacterium sp. E-005]MCJ2085087.1 adenine nucleotide alpha hydrolase [Methylobacterium sp. E-005]